MILAMKSKLKIAKTGLVQTLKNRVESLHLPSIEQLMIDIQAVEARQQASSKDDRYL